MQKKKRFPAKDTGEKTRTYFSLNAFMRELIGYLYLKRKLHIASVILIALVFIGQMIIK